MGFKRKAKPVAEARRNDGQEGRFRVQPDAGTETVGEQASSGGVVLFTLVLFCAAFAVALAGGFILQGSVTLAGIIVSLLVAALLAASCHIAQQWERVVVLRLGAFNRGSGPGLFWT